MKPQCTTAAQCLKEMARVMEQFKFNRILECLYTKYVQIEGVPAYKYEWHSGPLFETPSNWSFAIADVEGKPVFPGDVLFENNGICSVEWIAKSLNSDGHIVCVSKKEQSHHVRFVADELSWNPPKPKTVMVEMLREDAELFTEYDRKCFSNPDQRLSVACAKALKESE